MDFYNHEDKENKHLAGVTHLVHSSNGVTREMYIQGSFNQEKLKDVIYHELGHAIDFESQGELLSDSDIVRSSALSERDAVIKKYGLKNDSVKKLKEYFAEALRISIVDNEGFHKCAPIMSEYLDTVNYSAIE